MISFLHDVFHPTLLERRKVTCNTFEQWPNYPGHLIMLDESSLEMPNIEE